MVTVLHFVTVGHSDSCFAKQHSDETNAANDADKEMPCHAPTSSVTIANETPGPVYEFMPADVIETTPNVVYSECIDGIEMKPNEVYGFGNKT